LPIIIALGLFDISVLEISLNMQKSYRFTFNVVRMWVKYAYGQNVVSRTGQF